MKSLKSIFTAVILCFSVILISCSSGGDGSQQSGNISINETADNNTEIIEETEVIPYDAHLPDINLEGMELRFLNVDEESFWWSIAEIDAESETGDIINDAIYTRNRIVEEKYNFNIKEIRVPSWSITSTLRNSVSAGGDDYDVVIPFSYDMGTIASGGLLLDLNALQHINLENPWWGKSAGSFSIFGKTYFAVSDFLLTDKENVSIMMYNKNIAVDLGLLSDDELYTLVDGGGWTHDIFNKMTADASADLNGNGVRDVDDRYGLLAID